MRHGYTNITELVGDTVLKRYVGPAAADRALIERRALTQLADLFPVPDLIAASADSVTTRFLTGDHGQDLIESERADDVPAECGRLLRVLHAIDPGAVGFEASAGVIQHGDFGPNNVIFKTEPLRATGVLDWEFSRVGPAITDLAWCEWIVRMHHPSAIASLPHFFTAYGARPAWSQRHTEMLRRRTELEEFCRKWVPDHPGIALWQSRRAKTATWQPLAEDAE